MVFFVFSHTYLKIRYAKFLEMEKEMLYLGLRSLDAAEQTIFTQLNGAETELNDLLTDSTYEVRVIKSNHQNGQP